MTRRIDIGRIGLTLLLGLLAGLGLPGATQPAVAQQAPNAAQLEAFKSLPAEQQRAILEQMSRGGGAQADTRLEFPATTQPRTSLTELERQRLLELERVPTLRSGDLVVLDIALRAAGEDDFTVEAAPAPPASGQPAQGTGEAASGEARPAPAPAPSGAGLSDLQRQVLGTMRTALLDANPYRLDRNGAIVLPGIGSIVVAGLTEPQATKRLAADPALRGLRIRLTLLPVERQGVDALKPFGYEMFRGAPTTFAPASDIPVPGEYVIGPGDTLQVQLLGATKGDHSLVVGRNGELRLPELGPVAVAGLRFAEARRVIEETVAERMIGTRAVVSMGALKSITIFVTGEAEQPGSYTVSSLSTITNALFATGGVREIGSLRNIQLKRRGQLVATLDLYDLLLKGDTRNDLRLSAGDVIFIPPVGATVGVTGEIRRPAIYELRGETRAADLLYLAGGLTPEADPHLATLERVGTQQVRSVTDLDLTTPGGRGTTLRSGDLLRLRAVRPDMGNAVALEGHLHRPGLVGWRQGLWLTDVLSGADDLRPRADLNYVLIRREDASRRVSVVSADLEQAWRAPRGQHDVMLAPRDRVHVFSLEGGREFALKPILDDLRRQGQLGAPSRVVGVGGRVRAAGQYPLEPGMRVSDLIRAGGGLDEAAYGSLAELTRYEVVNGESRSTGLVEIDLARVVAGDPAADFALQPFDYLVIKELPQWSDQETVTIDGEVRFPGTYPIKRGETLLSVIGRAGGITELAFPEGSVFTRESLKVREAKQIEALARRLQSDLASLALQATQVGPQGGNQSATQAVAVGQTLLQGLRETQPVGRLVIDLDAVMAGAPGSERDLVLKNGDRLIVPPRAQEVTVLGEVQSSTSHVWTSGLGRDDYVRLSGGMTQKADDKRVYVVRANGSVSSGSGSRWFSNGDQTIRPGDTIVVPLDAERMRPLPLWTAVTTIIYNLAIAVAAVNSF